MPHQRLQEITRPWPAGMPGSPIPRGPMVFCCSGFEKSRAYAGGPSVDSSHYACTGTLRPFPEGAQEAAECDDPRIAGARHEAAYADVAHAEPAPHSIRRRTRAAAGNNGRPIFAPETDGPISGFAKNGRCGHVRYPDLERDLFHPTAGPVGMPGSPIPRGDMPFCYSGFEKIAGQNGACFWG